MPNANNPLIKSMERVSEETSSAKPDDPLSSSNPSSPSLDKVPACALRRRLSRRESFQQAFTHQLHRLQERQRKIRTCRITYRSLACGVVGLLLLLFGLNWVVASAIRKLFA